MTTRYPGYDVQAKRGGPSWDDITREVIDQRTGVRGGPRFLSPAEFRTLAALCARILPQPPGRPLVPLAAIVDAKLAGNQGDGYRDSCMPPLREAWKRGLAALDAEAQARHQKAFAALPIDQRDALLRDAHAGELSHPAWKGMPPKLFFTRRVLHDIVGAYYSHPQAWSEIGFGGPANPRGYVRLAAGHRDAWEAAEAGADNAQKARELNRRVR